MPAAPVLGGDHPFIRCLIGVSTSPQVESSYNMGVWDKAAAAAWLQVDVRRTLDNEAAACHQYQVTGRSLDNGGCIAEPHIVVDRCSNFLCILHCCTAFGRPQVAFVEARLQSLPKENAEAVQRLLYRAGTEVKLGATAAPDGEEAKPLCLVWEEMGPLLAYAPQDPEWQAVVAMRDLLRDLYSDTPPLNDLGASAVARQYRASLGVGVGAVCADVVESLNAISKRAYNDHTARGGGGGDAGGHIPRKGRR